MRVGILWETRSGCDGVGKHQSHVIVEYTLEI